MDKELLDELMYCLSEDKTKIHYFKDKYCLFLLQQIVKEKTKVHTLKQGAMAHLFNKPVVKNWLASCGGQQIHPWMVEQLWGLDLHHFTLTLGSWGGDSPSWQQTCRKGHNLVLQLNFSSQHDRFLDKLSTRNGDQFKCHSHPIHAQKQTLAWARLDVSDDLSEVLIEEIQNDWLRKALGWHDFLSGEEMQEEAEFHGFVNWQLLDRYVNRFIKPLLSVWHEAMLCTAVEFIRNEIGAKRIYMYEHQTGCALKQIGQYSQPPKSLYTKLPKQFGFKLSEQAPDFLQQDRFAAKKMKRFEKQHKTKCQWFNLNLNTNLTEELKHAS
ncbi:hypothetical protein [Marinicella rhabdoformis]|uniref:hypothetical protein n=1 Tax=Marinicella rhabdoformis TaxID=2580566 RepID=UPI0012AEB4BF|nr:hypothetical protein [Marinicella rhabdoformis]